MSPVATLRPQRRLSLHALLDGFADAPAFDAEVTGLSADSRELQAGDAFVALAGATTHGLRFAGTAQAAGVAAILFERRPRAPRCRTRPWRSRACGASSVASPTASTARPRARWR